MEEAFLRSTAPLDVDPETPITPVRYLYDAAAERAKELDKEEQLKRQQLRNSIIRSSTGGSANGPSPASHGGSAGAANAGRAGN